MELKLKLVTIGPGRWWVVGGWTKTKFMLFSTQVEVGIENGVELGKSYGARKLIFQISFHALFCVEKHKLKIKN